MGRRVIPGNGTVVTAVVYEPDAHGVRVAGSMAVATNPFSPMAVGVYGGRAGAPGFARGAEGYGVNRMTGRTNPLQFFAGAAAAVAPLSDPRSRRLGAGAGPSGQPGLPSTGQDDGAGLAGWWTRGQLGRLGMGA